MLHLRRNSTADSDPDFLTVTHAGITHRVALKRVNSARRFILRVRAVRRDVILTIPERGSVTAARDFAQRHAGWITARLGRLLDPVAFRPGAVVPLRGHEHIIVHCPDSRGTVWIEPNPDVESLDRARFAIFAAGDRAHIERRVTDYFKRQARHDLEQAVERHARTIAVAVRSITLRDTTSRWGSCSTHRSLNFSWRLIMAPTFVLDYLAAHEVAHLLEMKHSPRFWKITRRLAPHTDQAEVWLKVHGADLHRFGSESPSNI